MLETLKLPGRGRVTTRLGFGCSGLMGGLSERESLRLLETAFDAGIRHFDVAPSYGHGMAERCLGKFLRGKTDKITVATKYGILPARQASVFDIARRVVRPVVRQIPGLRRRAAQAAAAFKTKAHFSAEEAQRSLEHSLLELGVDCVDLWLLHEATSEDLSDPDLLVLLQEEQEGNKIGAYGMGTARQSLGALWKHHHEYCMVLQFDWSVMDERPLFPGAFCICHRSISGALGKIQETFQRQPAVCRRWSNEVTADLADTKILAAILLRASLLLNLNGLVLFSSRVPEHIETNVRVAENPAWTSRAIRLLELIAKEHSHR